MRRRIVIVIVGAVLAVCWWGVPPLSGQESNGLRFEVVRIGVARYLRVSSVDPLQGCLFPSPPSAYIERGDQRWSLHGEKSVMDRRGPITWGGVSVVRPGTPLLFHIKAPSGTLILHVRDGDYVEEVRRDAPKKYGCSPGRVK